MEQRERLSEKDFIERLRKKYLAPEWAFFDHVPSGTGGAAGRTADGIAFNLWPSRGLSILGFEVKSYRNDFLNELKNPEKSAEIQQFCDYWYIVAESDVVKPGEMPETWGLMVPHGKGLRIEKEAPLLKAQPVTRTFMAGIARTIHKESYLPEEIEAKIKIAFKEGKEAGIYSKKIEIEGMESRLKSLRREVDEFQRKSGIKIEEWRSGDVADMIRMLRDHSNQLDIFGDLKKILENAERDIYILRKAEEQMRKVREDAESEKPEVSNEPGSVVQG